MEMLASSGRFMRLVAGVDFAASDNVYISTALQGEGSCFWCSVHGTAQEHATAFLCRVNMMVRRRQAATGYEEAGRVLQWSGVGANRLATNE